MIDVHDYHCARAVAELAAAERSTCREAVQAHCALAELHLERARVARPPNMFERGGDLPDASVRLREIFCAANVTDPVLAEVPIVGVAGPQPAPVSSQMSAPSAQPKSATKE